MDKKVFQYELLNWWKDNKRSFPWRQTNNAYELLIAEVMLRKTTSQQVLKIYDIFISSYPSSEALKSAVVEDLISLLKPLGMEKIKAELLIKLAFIVTTKYQGKIPENKEELVSLPSVGSYSANAVLSLIYNKDVPMLDTNFIRLLERLFEYKTTRARARDDKEVWFFAETLIPQGHSKELNLAVLDFGALVCTAKKPKCLTCPFNSCCPYYLSAVKKD